MFPHQTRPFPRLVCPLITSPSSNVLWCAPRSAALFNAGPARMANIACLGYWSTASLLSYLLAAAAISRLYLINFLLHFCPQSVLIVCYFRACSSCRFTLVSSPIWTTPSDRSKSFLLHACKYLFFHFPKQLDNDLHLNIDSHSMDIDSCEPDNYLFCLDCYPRKFG